MRRTSKRWMFVGARGMITLKRGHFYDSKGYSVGQTKAEPKSIVIQTGDGKVMRVYGPVFR